MIDKDITPATITWPEHSKNWYYAYGGILDLETGECIFGQKIQQVDRRLQEAIQAVSQGTFQPIREKDELTYALQNPEHPGHTRGKGVVPRKFGFRDYIDTYRSQERRRNVEREHLRRLEEQLLS